MGSDSLGRRGWIVLAAAGAVAAVLLLWLNRGTSFYLDEMVWFSNLSGETDLSSILQPHNSHLIGTARLLFLAVAELFGPDYVVVRVVAVASLLLCSALFYAWAKRRIGDLWALLPAILLLFFGSAWQHVVGPIGFTITFSIALGLAALLAIERDDRRGDVLACIFVSLSVFTYTVGLGYLVGIGILVLLRTDRFRRAWIFLIPLLLYGGWYLWAQQFEQGRTGLSNAGHVVSYFGESLSAVSGALTGLSIPFSRFGEAADVSTAPPGAAGWIVAVVLVALVAWRFRRGEVNPTIYASFGVLGTYWLAAALSDPLYFGSQADAVRYILPGSVGVLLVLCDAAKGIRIRGGWAVAALALFLFSLAMNLVFLRDGASYLRLQATTVRANLAMLELGNGWLPGGGPVGGDGVPRYQVSPLIAYLGYGPNRDEYLAAVARYGSPAFDLGEVRALTAADRSGVDRALTETYAMGLNPSDPPPDRNDCRAVAPADGQFPLPAGGAYAKARGPEPATLVVGRFGDLPVIAIGQAEPGVGWTRVLVPTDQAPEQWSAAITTGEGAVVCPVA